MTTPDDMHWMQHALEIARQGQGTVEPNPMVGCVIVQNDQCIASGWHQFYGKEHAEIRALQTLPDGNQDLSQASLYVTLEPCCHEGKTPPCTQAILDAGIRRVVVGLTDPFPQVNGGGIAELQQQHDQALADKMSELESVQKARRRSRLSQIGSLQREEDHVLELAMG